MRKLILATIIFVTVATATATTAKNAARTTAGLPPHAQMQPLTLEPIKIGHEIVLDINVQLPTDHMLNKGAPSAVDIYEIIDKSWKKTGTVDMNSFFGINNTLSVHTQAKLQTVEGPVAIDSTIYHCDNKHTHCVIESFQGLVKRSVSRSSNSLAIHLNGTRP